MYFSSHIHTRLMTQRVNQVLSLNEEMRCLETKFTSRCNATSDPPDLIVDLLYPVTGKKDVILTFTRVTKLSSIIWSQIGKQQIQGEV